MPLTPEDVRNKQFTTVRLREGYDEDEVDAFLDEVEAELTRLLRENEDLRAKLAAATRAAAQNQQQGMRKPRAAGPAGARRHIRAAAGARSRCRSSSMGGPPQLPGGAPQLPAGPRAARSSRAARRCPGRARWVSMGQGPQGPWARARWAASRVPGRWARAARWQQMGRSAARWAAPWAAQDAQQQGPGGDSAARVLSLAQQTADQAIAEARSEANKIVGEARSRAEGLERDARAKADALERDAQEKHRVAMGSLESARATLERKVEDLRGFEREYRTRLKSYLESPAAPAGDPGGRLARPAAHPGRRRRCRRPRRWLRPVASGSGAGGARPTAGNPAHGRRRSAGRPRPTAASSRCRPR